MGKNFILIFLLFPLFWCAQSSTKDLDSLQSRVFDYRKEGNLIAALDVSKKIIQKRKNSGGKRELLLAYVQTGNILANLSRAKESFYYLDLASEENIESMDSEVEAKIYGEYGRNYMALGFNKKAIEYFSKGIELSKNITDTKIRNPLQQYLYSTRAVLYEEHGQLDEFYKDLHTAYNIYPDVYAVTRIAKYFTIYRENLDSAKYYLDKGVQMYSTGKFPIFQKSVLLRNYGRYHFQKKNYQKAIDYYKQSLAISYKLKKPRDQQDTYKLLYEAYKAAGDEDSAGINLEQYSRINDSLSLEHRKIQDTPVKHILREKEMEVAEEQKNYLLGIFITVLLIVTCICFVLRKMAKSNRKEKQAILSQVEAQTQELKLKVNESFEEVIHLAKTNSPEFWGRFQEVYPEFRGKLLAINPDLKPSELILCAYIYLGFTAKDIAEYTFKAVKTITNNKYNLRKRLNILSKDDFIIWMRDVMN